jgi:hypothetical protein
MSKNVSRNKSAETKPSTEQLADAVALNAKAVTDRRAGLDRRNVEGARAAYSGPERRSPAEVHADDETGLHRLRGPGRRREDERRSAEEGEMTANQFEFVMAVEAYKKVNHKMYPTWTEIMEVLYQLGYRKIMARGITLPNVPEAPLYMDVVEGLEETDTGGKFKAA